MVAKGRNRSGCLLPPSRLRCVNLARNRRTLQHHRLRRPGGSALRASEKNSWWAVQEDEEGLGIPAVWGVRVMAFEPTEPLSRVAYRSRRLSTRIGVENVEFGVSFAQVIAGEGEAALDDDLVVDHAFALEGGVAFAVVDQVDVEVEPCGRVRRSCRT